MPQFQSPKVIFCKGQEQNYQNLRNKDAYTLYFCTDTGNLYLGDNAIFESNAFVSATYSQKQITFTKHSGGTVTMSLSELATTQEVTDAINNALSGIFRFKGSCEYDELPISGQQNGDVYIITDDFNFPPDTDNVLPAGTSLVWVDDGEGGGDWQVLSGMFDMSQYMTKPSNPNPGNLASFLSDGNVVDSGYSSSSFKLRQTPIRPGSGTESWGNAFPVSITNGEENTNLYFVSEIYQDAQGVVSGIRETLPIASRSNYGLMSNEESAKLNSIEPYAQVNKIEAISTFYNNTNTPIEINNKQIVIATNGAYSRYNPLVTEDGMVDYIAQQLRWNTIS